MKGSSPRLQAELQRLAKGPPPGAKPGGAGTVRFIARCPMGAKEVLEKVKSVLQCIDETALADWPADEKWVTILPDWFTAACVPPMTPQQAQTWLASWKRLSPQEQTRQELEKDWALPDWLYWMEPSKREWYWWDARALDDVDHVMVAVEVDGWPFPWGALRWLFRAAGASALDPEE